MKKCIASGIIIGLLMLIWAGNAHATPQGTLVWNGAASTSWNNADNWQYEDQTPGIVPTADWIVEIPADKPRYPDTYTANPICADLIIDTGAYLTLTNGYDLTIAYERIKNHGTLTVNNNQSYIYCYGNWGNDGVFNHGNSRVYFKTESGSSIEISGATTFHDIYIDSMKYYETVTISDHITATNIIVLQGTLCFLPSENITVTVTGDFKLNGPNDGSLACLVMGNNNKLYCDRFFLQPGTENITGGEIHITSATDTVFTCSGAGSDFTPSGGTVYFEGGDVVNYKNTANTAFYNLLISNNTTLMPESASCKPLEITGSLQINSGSTLAMGKFLSALCDCLSIQGNFTNNGAFIPGDSGEGYITFTGAAASQINGTEPLNFSNLTIQKYDQAYVDMINKVIVEKKVIIESGVLKISGMGLSVTQGPLNVKSGAQLEIQPSRVLYLGNGAQALIEPNGTFKAIGTSRVVYPKITGINSTGSTPDRYSFVVSGIINARYYWFDQLNASGLVLDNNAIIQDISEGKFTNPPAGGTLITYNTRGSGAIAQASGIEFTSSIIDNRHNVTALDPDTAQITFADAIGNLRGTAYEHDPYNLINWSYSNASITKISGDLQIGLVDTTLPQPFQVRVTDGSGNPIAGESVEYKVTQGTGRFIVPPEPPNFPRNNPPENLPDFFGITPDGYHAPFSATGTTFVINHPLSPNLIITSTEEIHIILRAVTNTFSYNIEAVDPYITQTTITISGLEPFFPTTQSTWTLFRHQDGYFQEEFTLTTTDTAYSYTQDISTQHHVYILPRRGTLQIGTGQSSPYYTYDPNTNTYTLIQDVNDYVVVIADNLTLDGNGHTITGPGDGYGVYLRDRTAVTITNCTVVNFFTGIYLFGSSYIQVINNIAHSNFCGIETNGVSYTSIMSNTVSSNYDTGISCFISTENTFSYNITNLNGKGIIFNYGATNTIFAHTGIANTYGAYFNGGTYGNILTNSTFSENNVGVVLASSPDNIIYHNNIYNNDKPEGAWIPGPYNVCSVQDVYPFETPDPAEISHNGEGNWWGHIEAPGFVAGEDSNAINVTDTYPYLVWDGWNRGYGPGEPEFIYTDTIIVQTDAQGYATSNYSFKLGSSPEINYIRASLTPYDFGSLPVTFTARSTETTSPTIYNLTPANGSVVTTTTMPLISADYNDSQSGINPATALMMLCGITVSATADASGISYTPTTALSQGAYNVYVYVADNEGNPAEAEWSFVVDTITPTGSIVIDNGNWVTTDTINRFVTLTLSTVDLGSGVGWMKIKNDNDPWPEIWTAYETPKSWQLSEGLGTKTVYVRYKDNAGWISTVYSDTIVLAEDHNGNDWVFNSNEEISGVHCNINKFTIPEGITVTTQSMEILEIYAQNICISGALSADGKGSGSGPGAGQNGTSYYDNNYQDYCYGGGGGAGYGGVGGKGAGEGGGAGGVTYGNPLAPTEFGSGGGQGAGGTSGGVGGGVIILHASETITVTGTVSANGTPGNNAGGNWQGGGGGGSGGSIWFFANLITGGSIIQAKGGNGGNAYNYYLSQAAAGAGGGRIKFNFKYFEILLEHITVAGGIKGWKHPGNPDAEDGAEGTIEFLSTPDNPSDLTATATSSSQTTISWVDNSYNEERFEIERKPESGTYETIAYVYTISPDDGSGITIWFSDDVISPDTTYYYRVRAYNESGYSDYTDEITVTTLMQSPSNVGATPTTFTLSQIDLGWTNNSTTAEYISLERKIGYGDFVQIATVDSNIVSYSDTGLSPDTRYYYRIKIYREGNQSNYSDETNAVALRLTVDYLSGVVTQDYNLNLITDYGVYQALLGYLSSAESSCEQGDLDSYISQLDLFNNKVISETGITIDQNTGLVLVQMGGQLKEIKPEIKGEDPHSPPLPIIPEGYEVTFSGIVTPDKTAGTYEWKADPADNVEFIGNTTGQIIGGNPITPTITIIGRQIGGLSIIYVFTSTYGTVISSTYSTSVITTTITAERLNIQTLGELRVISMVDGAFIRLDDLGFGMSCDGTITTDPISDTYAARWELGFLQNVRAMTYTLTYSTGAMTATITPIFPSQDFPLLDGPGEGIPITNSKESFIGNNSSVHVVRTDTPSTGLGMKGRNDPRVQGAIVYEANQHPPRDYSWLNDAILTEVKREDHFITWVIAKNIDTGEIIYLFWVGWTFIQHVTFDANGKAHIQGDSGIQRGSPGIGQGPPPSPKLTGPIANDYTNQFPPGGYNVYP